MKINSEGILAGVLALFLATGIALALLLDRKEAGERVCTAIEVDPGNGYHFLDEEDVNRVIREGYGDCIGLGMESISLHGIERVLDNQGAVLKSQVWMTPDGVVHVNLVQRTPIARFQKGKDGYYVDRTGTVFPLQRSYTVQVPVIDGNLQGIEEDAIWVDSMVNLVEYMDATPWSKLISQISVLRNGDLLMIPTEGREVFVFGGPDRYEVKFGRMEKYYTHILPEKGPGFYGCVNVKNRGQIICTK